MPRIWFLVALCAACSSCFAQTASTSCPAPAASAQIAAGKASATDDDEALQKDRAKLSTATTPTEKAEITAQIIRVLVRQRQTSEVTETAEQALREFPNDAGILAAAGDAAFLAGDMELAAQLLNAANKINPCDWHTHTSMAHYLHLTGMHASEEKQRDLSWKLYGPRPSHSEIPTEELARLREKLKDTTLSEVDRATAEYRAKYLKLRLRTACRTDTPRGTATIPVFAVRERVQAVTGPGVKIRINGKEFRFLLDSLTSGIYITSRAAKSANLNPELETKASIDAVKGIFAKRRQFYAVSDVQIGDLKYTDCLVTTYDAISTPGDVDGYIGLNVFASYLLTLDFPSQQLRLDALPARPGEDASPLTGRLGVAGYDPNEVSTLVDRYIDPSMRNWTRFYRDASELIIPTRVNGDAGSWLFILSTGLEKSYLSSENRTELTANSKAVLLSRGGSVLRAAPGEQTTLAFGNVVQPIAKIENRSMRGFTRVGTTIGGQIGFDALKNVRVSIDYRDNLINFTQDKDKVTRELPGRLR